MLSMEVFNNIIKDMEKDSDIWKKIGHLEKDGNLTKYGYNLQKVECKLKELYEIKGYLVENLGG